MLPDKKRQIGSIIGMLIMMAILVFANLGGTWSVISNWSNGCNWQCYIQNHPDFERIEK